MTLATAALDVVTAGCLAISVCAISYLLFAIWCVARFPRAARVAGDRLPAISIFKPLCGDEPGLREGLRSFCSQSYPAPIQLIFGAQLACDPAILIARELKAEYPDRDIEIVIDATVHGPNLKSSNLLNMERFAKHDVFVLSDSDVYVEADCLSQVATAFENPSVGAVTCLYRGAPIQSSSGVAQLGALYIDAWFLPSALIDARLSRANACYGPVTAVRRSVVERGGGFASLTHVLADDAEIGLLTARQGKQVSLAPFAVDTSVSETSLQSLLRHELRWARATRALRPAGYIASVVTHALPVVLTLLVLWPSPVSGILTGSVVALRAILLATVEARFGRAPTASSPTPWFLAVRELLYFGVWATAFASRRITWRGRKLRILPGARLAVDNDGNAEPRLQGGAEGLS